MEIALDQNKLRITQVGAGAYRVALLRGKTGEGGLNRYGILSENTAAESGDSALHYEDGMLKLCNGGQLILTGSFTQPATGFDVSFGLADREALYGLGDVTRKSINKRGFRGRMWVTNVNSYAPIPFLMSPRGWGVLLNTTFDHYVDAGAHDPDTLRFWAREGELDFYLFAGGSLGQLLERYTAVAGRPVMLPRWAFGLTFVCNTHADDGELISDALNFRREDIPCDLLGLEPGWMETNYDGTVAKKWSEERFPIPYYASKGPHTFLGAVDRLGYKLSLWLCCDYDVSHHEESLLGEQSGEKIYEEENANVRFEQDEHFKNDAVRMDRITVPGQPWFGHLKKFVDQGVSAFKLDGAYMVLDHPDRLYGNGMTDGEMHNLYPVLLNKQMARGFTEHTGRRAMIYSAGGYTGIQRYSATWAGDTGGGFEPLVSMLNHGLSGHSNTSCDMDVFSVESIHFGFLQPWSQLNSWNYWRHPWLLADEDKEIFRDYAKLRYAFVPYLYTAAHIANRTGMPVMRAMPLIYPDGGFDDCMNQYMLGDSLLVCTFPKGRCMTLRMPEGKWHDFFTGEIYTGPAEIKYDIPEGKGGALLVKDGSVIPMAQPRKFIGDKPYDSYILHVYGRRARGMLYSDDGITPRYLEGEYVISDISAELKGGRLEISVSSEGGYAGMPEEVTYTAVTHGFGAEETLIDG